MKLETLSITHKQGWILNTSFGLFIFFSVLTLGECWGKELLECQGLMRPIFDLTSYGSFGQAFLCLGLSLSSLIMLEVFRRCLKKDNQFLMHSLVVTIMISIFVITISHFYEFFQFVDMFISGFMFGTELGYNSVANAFRVVLFLPNIFLCVELMRKYAGRLRLYGASLVACSVLFALINIFRLFLRYSECELTDSFGFASIICIFNCVIGLIPFFLLRFTMVVKEKSNS